MKIIIQSIKNYFKSKKDKGLEPVFFEKIGDQKTSREEMRNNLIKALEKNGWTIKNKQKGNDEKCAKKKTFSKNSNMESNS